MNFLRPFVVAALGALAAAAAAVAAGAPAVTTPAAGATGAPRTTTILEYVQAGGILSYVMIGMSVLALALIIRNLSVLRLGALAPPRVVGELDRLLRDGDIGGAQRFCTSPESNSFITEIFRTALDRCIKSPFGVLETNTAIEESAQAETARLHRLNDGIGILAAVGPMLGLLGTVIGMIGAFNSIGSLQGSARSTELARFMSMALVNTAEGLIVAIPCTVVFALFRRRIDQLVAELTPTIEDLAAKMADALSSRGAGRVGTGGVGSGIDRGVAAR